MSKQKVVLPALVDYIKAHPYGDAVVLTPAEHAALKAEMGSTGSGTISMFEGAKIVIGSQSDLSLPETVMVTVPMSLWKPKPEPDVFKEDPAPKKKKKKPVKVYHKSGNDEHSTPQALFDRLDEEFTFNLDVCATPPLEIQADGSSVDWIPGTPMLDPGNAKCPIYFTKEDDGLAQQWFGRVWMNPPYTHGQVGKWIQKLLHELISGRIELAVALVASRPDTQWWQPVASYASEIRFLKGRLTFEGEPHPAPFPSAVLIFDPAAKTQSVKFWDWQHGTAPVYWKTPGYTFVPGKPGMPGMALPSLKGLKPSKLALVK